MAKKSAFILLRSFTGDWQDLFSQTPIGIWHSPAWIEAEQSDHDEAEAVADAYFSVANTTSLRVNIFMRDILKISQRP